MERILKYRITEADANKTIREFLLQRGYSKQNLTELKKMPESILVNGSWEYMTARVNVGDELWIHIQEMESSKKIPPRKLPFPVLYEDEDLVVVNKPANMPIHPSMNHYENTLGNAAAYYYEIQQKPFIFRCMNRLDRDTTGLTVLAKHMVSAGILQSSMQMQGIHREYLAIVAGILKTPEGIIEAPIGRVPGSAIERRVDYEHGERAVTEYRVLGYKIEGKDKEENATLVRLCLRTGRTHQIRVHMASIGHPLLGDFLYYPEDERMPRQALHAWHLTFLHPITGEKMQFEAPVPEDMRQFWGACEGLEALR